MNAASGANPSFICVAGATCSPSGNSGACACASPDSECGTGAPTQSSGAICTNLNTDSTNCGRCGTNCTTSGEFCSTESGSPKCQPSCPGSEVACGSSCANLQTDPNNCGACGTVCVTGAQCVLQSDGGSSCQCAGTDPNTCPANGSPVVGAANPATCTNFATDPNNCGSCSAFCQGGQSCTDAGAGNSACECPSGTELTSCGGAELCVNRTNDNAHCGASCQNCTASDEICTTGTDGGGICATSCQGGTVLCTQTGSPYCADTNTDPNNCGVCGIQCVTGAACNGGTCACAGATPNECDGGVPAVDGGAGNSPYCTNLTNDVNNCNGCGIVCNGGIADPNGTWTCAAVQGHGDCIDVCSTGFTFNPQLGACENGCNGSNNGSACTTTSNAQGICCGNNDCVAYFTDTNNCGGCGIVCESGLTCQNGQCSCQSANDGTACDSIGGGDLLSSKRHGGKSHNKHFNPTGGTSGSSGSSGGSDYLCCNNSCVNADVDSNNCGGCGNDTATDVCGSSINGQLNCNTGSCTCGSGTCASPNVCSNEGSCDIPQASCQGNDGTACADSNFNDGTCCAAGSCCTTCNAGNVGTTCYNNGVFGATGVCDVNNNCAVATGNCSEATPGAPCIVDGSNDEGTCDVGNNCAYNACGGPDAGAGGANCIVDSSDNEGQCNSADQSCRISSCANGNPGDNCIDSDGSEGTCDANSNCVLSPCSSGSSAGDVCSNGSLPGGEGVCDGNSPQHCVVATCVPAGPGSTASLSCQNANANAGVDGECDNFGNCVLGGCASQSAGVTCYLSGNDGICDGHGACVQSSCAGQTSGSCTNADGITGQDGVCDPSASGRCILASSSCTPGSSGFEDKSCSGSLSASAAEVCSANTAGTCILAACTAQTVTDPCYGADSTFNGISSPIDGVCGSNQTCVLNSCTSEPHDAPCAGADNGTTDGVCGQNGCVLANSSCGSPGQACADAQGTTSDGICDGTQTCVLNSCAGQAAGLTCTQADSLGSSPIGTEGVCDGFGACVLAASQCSSNPGYACANANGGAQDGVCGSGGGCVLNTCASDNSQYGSLCFNADALASSTPPASNAIDGYCGVTTSNAVECVLARCSTAHAQDSCFQADGSVDGVDGVCSGDSPSHCVFNPISCVGTNQSQPCAPADNGNFGFATGECGFVSGKCDLLAIDCNPPTTNGAACTPSNQNGDDGVCSVAGNCLSQGSP